MEENVLTIMGITIAVIFMICVYTIIVKENKIFSLKKDIKDMRKEYYNAVNDYKQEIKKLQNAKN